MRLMRFCMNGIVQSLVILLITLQISSCSSEDNFFAIPVAADRTLTWVAPTEREDNTPLQLSDIAGFRIYYGTAQGEYTDTVDINDRTAEQAEVPSLTAGITYYIVVTAIDIQGRESDFSNEVTLTI